MPPRHAPGTPEEWLLRARSNLAVAKSPKPVDALWEEYCFQAHQAIEKSLKAVYQKRGLLFEYVHDIEVLGAGLERAGVRVPPEVRMAIGLTRYAREMRYPADHEWATREDHSKALAWAEAVVKWADKIVKTPDKPGGSLLKEAPGSYRAKKSRKSRVVKNSKRKT